LCENQTKVVWLTIETNVHVFVFFFILFCIFADIHKGHLNSHVDDLEPNFILQIL